MKKYKLQILLCFVMFFSQNSNAQLSIEQIKAFSAAKIIRFTISQSYGEVEYENPNIEKMVLKFIEYANRTALPSDTLNKDLLFKIDVTGTALSGNYTIGRYYTGAYIEGTISLEIQGVTPYKVNFKGEREPQKTLPVAYADRFKNPSNAPFQSALSNSSFIEEIVVMMGSIYGYSWMLNAVKDEYGPASKNVIDVIWDKKDPEVIDILIIALNERQILATRRKAAQKLGELKATQAVEPLLNILIKNEERLMKFAAIEALGKIGDPRAVEPLIESLKDSWLVTYAEKALGEIKDPRAVDPLINQLHSIVSRGARVNAAEALGIIGDIRAVEPLIKVLNTDNKYELKAYINALRLITKEDLGENKTDWIQWWEANKENYSKDR